MTRFYLISGETSGDIHGANLIKALLELDPKSKFRAWGGDYIKNTNTPIARHIKETNFMGFWEIISNLPKILGLFKYAKKDLLDFNPDVVILIDYPGFNLRMAKWLKSKGIPVIYYISPQIWAWKPGRVYSIKKMVDLMITILPFEKEFYQKYNYEVAYVGHPLLDEINQIQTPKKHPDSKRILALLPGSRLQEIKKMLPVMIIASKKLSAYQPIIVKAPSIPIEEYQKLLSKEDHHLISNEGSINILRRSSLAAVSSGTATLETALLDVPQVVCYKGSEISYQIAKRLVNLKHISLVNLIMQETIVRELIQQKMNSKTLANALKVAADNADSIKIKYALLRKKLGSSGASRRAAIKITEYLESAR